MKGHVGRLGSRKLYQWPRETISLHLFCQSSICSNRDSRIGMQNIITLMFRERLQSRNSLPESNRVTFILGSISIDFKYLPGSSKIEETTHHQQNTGIQHVFDETLLHWLLPQCSTIRFLCLHIHNYCSPSRHKNIAEKYYL